MGLKIVRGRENLSGRSGGAPGKTASLRAAAVRREAGLVVRGGGGSVALRLAH